MDKDAIKPPADDDPPPLFDRIFKRLMGLSSGALVHFINGIFGKEYPPDSIGTSMEPEHITDHPNPWVSAGWIVVNHTDRHLIAIQMIDDDEEGEGALRLFNYSYWEGLKNTKIEEGAITVRMASAIVIYLEPTEATPHGLSFEANWGGDEVQTFNYPTLRFLDHSIAELEEWNLTMLLPFYLLKLRKQVEAIGTSAGRQALSGEMKRLVEELIEAIARGEQKGLMTKADKRTVLELMGIVYEGLYKAYPEFKETNELVDKLLVPGSGDPQPAG